MAIDAVEFPLNAKRLGASVEAAVLILTSFTGNETVNPNRSQMRRRFNAANGIKTLADLQTVIAFWHAMYGPSVGFLVKDWTDFKATQTATTLAAGITVQGRSTLIPSTTTYQLEKWYTVGGRTHKRKIRRPKTGTVTLSTAGAVDYTTGIVTGAPSAPDWLGEFFVPCRFEQKELPAELVKYASNGSGIVDVPDIPLIEILNS